jgi:hypothetical protein
MRSRSTDQKLRSSWSNYLTHSIPTFPSYDLAVGAGVSCSPAWGGTNDDHEEQKRNTDVIWTGRRGDFGCFFNGIDVILV